MSWKPYISVESDGTTWSDDGIPCPYCHHVHTDDLFEVPGAYTEYGGDMTCSSCEKDFDFSTSISYAYTGRKNQ